MGKSKDFNDFITESDKKFVIDSIDPKEKENIEDDFKDSKNDDFLQKWNNDIINMDDSTLSKCINKRTWICKSIEKSYITKDEYNKSLSDNLDKIKSHINSESILELDDYNRTVLHNVAIQINNLPNMIDIFKLIIDSGADVNVVDINNKTPLNILCTRSKSLEAIKYIVDKGADVNNTNWYGGTPFTDTIQFGGNDNETLKFLLENGADIKMKTKHKQILNSSFICDEIKDLISRCDVDINLINDYNKKLYQLSLDDKNEELIELLNNK
jgi:ankyrin repeat protein